MMLMDAMTGATSGDVVQRLIATNGDARVLRPWRHTDGRSYIEQTRNGKPVPVPVTNNPATLMYQDWLAIDEAVVKSALPRLRAVADLRSRGLQYSMPNGMGKTSLMTQTQSYITPATVSMDGLRESEGDRPVFANTQIPLPIIHKDFNFSARQIMASRNGGAPLDTSMAELAARRVAEQAEQMLLGTATSYTYGAGTIYGYTSFPSRITFAQTSPTHSSWLATGTVAEVLGMRLQSQLAYHYGPWILYNSPSWDKYLDEDYKATYNATTLRDRLKMIDGIQDVRTLDFLTGYVMLLVQMTSDTVREIVGLDITTVQWESHGGMQINFKVLCILVPDVRADYNGNCGIVHGTGS